jgi:mono/diheme cytochrome c family protein
MNHRMLARGIPQQPAVECMKETCNLLMSRNCLSLAKTAFISLCLNIPALSARAEDDALKRGYAIAVEKCSHCHAISHNDLPPHDIVIPFRQLHTRYPIAMLIEARDRGVIAGHDEMPMFTVSQPDMRALLSYIDSLAPAAPAYVPRAKRR